MSLVYDLGFHNGDDTAFYLSLGFKVLAVDANPRLVKEGKDRFTKEIASGQLVLLNRIISDDFGFRNFYIHPTKSDWSGCIRELVESDGSKAETITVDTTRIADLYSACGVPGYMKVDIEGCELMVVRQVSKLSPKPRHISFECPGRDYVGIFSYLYVSGYTGYQLRNQLNNKQCPSGSFGDNLPMNKWLSCNGALERYIKYKDLKQLDRDELGLGWLDLHARIG
jgi:FkbM family methyltransferase